jgi:hypothetical protein
VHLGQIGRGGILLQDRAHGLSEGVFDDRADFGKDQLQQSGRLTAVGLQIVEVSVAKTHQIAQPLDLIVRDITASGFSGAQKPGDDIGVDVVGLRLLGQQLPVAIGLEGIQELDRETL